MRKFSGDTLVLATHNKGKLVELQQELAGHGVTILTSADLPFPEPKETGTTFEENAAIKAIAGARATRRVVLADDSGLCVDALSGAPGVYSADWMGYPRNRKRAIHRIHAEMERSGRPDRTARFVTVMALGWPDGHVEFARGEVEGTIVQPGRGTGGFGMDPIFLPLGHARTFAEMSMGEKSALSHRSRALRALIQMCFV